MNFRRTARCALALMLLLLTGCGSYYSVGVHQFTDMDKALGYLNTSNRDEVRRLSRAQYSVDGSLLINLPSNQVLAAAPYIRGAETLNDERRAYLLATFRIDADTVKESVLKARLFTSATVRQGDDDPMKVAADLGYEYVYDYKGNPGFVLTQVATGRQEVLTAAPGLQNMMLAIERALRKMDTAPEGAVAAATPDRKGPARPTEAMQYDDATKRGWVSITAKGLGARRELLKRIAEICATKNKLLLSDDAETYGTFKVLDEELKDGTLKIYFESLY